MVELRHKNDSPMPASEPSKKQLQALWSEADAIWDKRGNERAFSGYVSADYAAIFRSLKTLRKRSHTFLEWGSGLGVVTIMASRLGFDAYGIEVETDLVDAAQDLAERHHASPSFGVGSFIPDAFEITSGLSESFINTREDGGDAYSDLDMELRDFDLVYAYPWPGELGIFRSIVRRYGSPHTLFLSYDVREGLALSRPAKNRRPSKYRE